MFFRNPEYDAVRSQRLSSRLASVRCKAQKCGRCDARGGSLREDVRWPRALLAYPKCRWLREGAELGVETAWEQVPTRLTEPENGLSNGAAGRNGLGAGRDGLSGRDAAGDDKTATPFCWIGRWGG